MFTVLWNEAIRNTNTWEHNVKNIRKEIGLSGDAWSSREVMTRDSL